MKAEKGVILILCLWFLASLSLLSLGFAHRTRLELKVTGFQKDRLYALHLAKAGVTRAIAELEKDENSYDSLNESWHAHPSWQEEGWFKDKNLEEQGIDVIYHVMDEESRININTASKDLLDGLPGIDEPIASAIIDWRDEDDIPEEDGVESAYYQSLSPPYSCRNARFETVDELLVVCGITRDTFFGEDTKGNGILDPNEDDGPLSPPSDNMDGALDKGIRDLVTVYGDGLINLNTASIDVLCAIPGVTGEVAKSIIDYRSGPDGWEATDDDVPFEKMEGLQSVPGMSEYEYNQLSSLGCVSSKYFSVSCKGILRRGKVQKKVVGIVDRSTKSARILSWKEN